MGFAAHSDERRGRHVHHAEVHDARAGGSHQTPAGPPALEPGRRAFAGCATQAVLHGRGPSARGARMSPPRRRVGRWYLNAVNKRSLNEPCPRASDDCDDRLQHFGAHGMELALQSICERHAARDADEEVDDARAPDVDAHAHVVRVQALGSQPLVPGCAHQEAMHKRAVVQQQALLDRPRVQRAQRVLDAFVVDLYRVPEPAAEDHVVHEHLCHAFLQEDVLDRVLHGRSAHTAAEERGRARAARVEVAGARVDAVEYSEFVHLPDHA